MELIVEISISSFSTYKLTFDRLPVDIFMYFLTFCDMDTSSSLLWMLDLQRIACIDKLIKTSNISFDVAVRFLTVHKLIDSPPLVKKLRDIVIAERNLKKIQDVLDCAYYFPKLFDSVIVALRKRYLDKDGEKPSDDDIRNLPILYFYSDKNNLAEEAYRFISTRKNRSMYYYQMFPRDFLDDEHLPCISLFFEMMEEHYKQLSKTPLSKGLIYGIENYVMWFVKRFVVMDVLDNTDAKIKEEYLLTCDKYMKFIFDVIDGMEASKRNAKLSSLYTKIELWTNATDIKLIPLHKEIIWRYRTINKNMEKLYNYISHNQDKS